MTLGVIDAAINMQAVALEHEYARPILPSFHGAWTVGGLIASALTLASADLDLRWMACVAVVPLVAATAPYLAHERAGAPSVDVPGVAVPWRPIMLVGAALVLFYMVDTAAFTWGPTYLDRVVDAPSDLVALATFPYLLASGLVRLAGDDLVRRFGAVRVLRTGALVASRRPGPHRLRADVAGRRAGLLHPRRRGGGGGAAELLRGRPDRRRRHPRPRRAAGAGWTR